MTADVSLFMRGICGFLHQPFYCCVVNSHTHTHTQTHTPCDRSRDFSTFHSRTHPEFLLVVFARGQDEMVARHAQCALYRQVVGSVEGHPVHHGSSDELHELHSFWRSICDVAVPGKCEARTFDSCSGHRDKHRFEAKRFCGVTRKPLTLEGMGDLVHRVME